MDSLFEYISDYYFSNCVIEAMKAKIGNPNVKIFYCKPRLVHGKLQMFHLMWSDGTADFDFSDDDANGLPWYRCILYKGRIRKFRLGVARKYSQIRNSQKRRCTNSRKEAEAALGGDGDG